MRAALRDQIDCQVEVDIVALSDTCRVERREARALQLLCSPLLDPFELCVYVQPCIRRSHISLFGGQPGADVPFTGG